MHKIIFLAPNHYLELLDIWFFPYSFVISFLTLLQKKMLVSHFISYVFYCFSNFLCISLFYRPFVFHCFLVGNYSLLLFSQEDTNIKLFQLVLVKILQFMWIYCKIPISIGFVHKTRFLSNFGLDKFFSKGRGFATLHAGALNLVSKVAR